MIWFTWHFVISHVWCFEWKFFLSISSIWTLGAQLVALFAAVMEPFKSGAWLKESITGRAVGVYTLIPLLVKAVFHCQASLIIRDSPCGPRAKVNAHSQAVLGPGVFHHRSREELRHYGKCPYRPSIVPKLMLVNPISTRFPLLYIHTMSTLQAMPVLPQTVFYILCGHCQTVLLAQLSPKSEK